MARKKSPEQYAEVWESLMRYNLIKPEQVKSLEDLKYWLKENERKILEEKRMRGEKVGKPRITDKLAEALYENVPEVRELVESNAGEYFEKVSAQIEKARTIPQLIKIDIDYGYPSKITQKLEEKKKEKLEELLAKIRAGRERRRREMIRLWREEGLRLTKEELRVRGIRSVGRLMRDYFLTREEAEEVLKRRYE